MGFEGQKEGFAEIRAKPSIGRSGVMYLLLFKHEVANPVLTSLHQETLGKEEKVAQVNSVYSTMVS